MSDNIISQSISNPFCRPYKAIQKFPEKAEEVIRNKNSFLLFPFLIIPKGLKLDRGRQAETKAEDKTIRSRGRNNGALF